MIANSLTGDVIDIVGSMFVDDIDLYCWKEPLKMGEELFGKIQEETHCLGKFADRNKRVPEAGE